jgi:CRP-like cAMP-binding protein
MSRKSPITQPPPPSGKLVQQSHLFSSLPEHRLQAMSKHFRIERWSKKKYIDQDILQYRFYLLLEGRIEMIRSNPDTGRSITLDLLYPGDGFDIIPLLDGHSHEMFFLPAEELNVISVPIEKMREWIWTYPELNRKFLPYLAQKMREQQDKTADLALHDTTTRLSRIILRHLNKIQLYTGISKNAHHDHLITGFSDEVLARLTGSVRQVINKQLQKWKKDKIIDKKRNKIIIKDLEKIMDAADITLSRFD